MKLTEKQKEDLLKYKEEIQIIQKKSDEVFNKLIKDLGFEIDENTLGYLVDFVYNELDLEIFEDVLKKL